MALSSLLGKKGYKSVKISIEANVHIDKIEENFRITKILLITRGEVADIDEKIFLELANEAKIGCSGSKALAATHIELDAAELKLGVCFYFIFFTIRTGLIIFYIKLF